MTQTERNRLIYLSGALSVMTLAVENRPPYDEPPDFILSMLPFITKEIDRIAKND